MIRIIKHIITTQWNNESILFRASTTLHKYWKYIFLLF